jgi:hypothetical protein
MLLPNEQQAKDFVLKIGQKRSERLLDLVCGRIKRRADKGNAQNPTMYFTESNVRKAQWEIDMEYNLKMGLTLTDDYNTPVAAKARIAARIAARNERRKERLSA